MPAVPYYPSDDDRRDERAPDIGDLVDRILRGGDDPTSVPQ
jgi:hypothetical protein